VSENNHFQFRFQFSLTVITLSPSMHRSTSIRTRRPRSSKKSPDAVTVRTIVSIIKVAYIVVACCVRTNAAVLLYVAYNQIHLCTRCLYNCEQFVL